jgi:uncharacterized protein with PQ loop repeat
MNTNIIIGICAVFTASVSLFPQIHQIVKTKKVEDLNRTFFLLCMLSELLYITYGFLERDYVMVASTIPPMVTQAIVICLHCKYKKIGNNEETIENN